MATDYRIGLNGKNATFALEYHTLKASESENVQILGVSYSDDHCYFVQKSFCLVGFFIENPSEGIPSSGLHCFEG